MAPPPKYIFVNGVMKLNPQYSTETGITSSVSKPSESLAIVSSTDDIMSVSEIQPDKPLQLSDSTTSSMEIMQDTEFTKNFGNNVDGGKLLDDLCKVFTKYEVPIGLVNKLLSLTDCEMIFLIDDSGSMAGDSDLLVKDMSTSMSYKMSGRMGGSFMNRWEEAENRLHILGEIFSFIPIRNINFCFLNNSEEFNLTRNSVQTPSEYESSYHQMVQKVFSNFRGGVTPLYTKLKSKLEKTSSRRRMIYVLTDGQPSDAEISTVSQLVQNRKDPENNPITFFTCSNRDEDTEWIKEVEEKAKFCSEIDDFISERKEVEHDQGAAFPYSIGFWILCMLVSAINPDDLDALDESKPFTRGTLNNLLGRKLSEQDYQEYWNKHPVARNTYSSKYSQYLREDLVARMIN